MKRIFFVNRPMSDLNFAKAFTKRFDFMISAGHFFRSGKTLQKEIEAAGGWKKFAETKETFFADCGAQQIMFKHLDRHKFLERVDEVYRLYDILKPDYAASLDYPSDTHLCKTDLYNDSLVGKRLTVEEIDRRIDLSLKSAEILLNRGKEFIGVPVIQGDPERPESFEYMAEILAPQSEFLGIGSLCMSRPPQILRCIRHLSSILKGHKVHIFGIGSIKLTRKLFQLPFIYSIDTASYRYAADRRKVLCHKGIYGHKHASEIFGDWVSEPTIGARILAFFYAYEVQVAVGLREENPLDSYKHNQNNTVKHGGRPRTSPKIITKIFKLRKEGCSIGQIAADLNISRTTVWRISRYDIF